MQKPHPVSIFGPPGHAQRVVAGLLAAIATAAAASAAHAGIAYAGGVGDTVYGVAPYVPPAQGAPVFIGNNVTGFNDILASPGHGFLLASPVVANNISQTGILPLPLGSFQTGGGNGFGAFGAGATRVNGPNVAFRLADSSPAAGSASYSISSWTSDFTVNGGGFAGNLGSYLAIGGQLSTAGSAAAASLVSEYYLNNVFQGATAPLILAAAGNGNFQALGGSGAALLFTGGGRFQGLAIDNLAANLAAGDKVKVVTTLTAYADPASFDTIDLISLDPSLLGLTGTALPDFAFASASGGVPEPDAWVLMLAGVFGLGGVLRLGRRRRVATA